MKDARVFMTVVPVLLAALGVGVAAASAGASGTTESSATPSMLSLAAETPSVTLDTVQVGSAKIAPKLDLGMFVLDSGGPFELRAARGSYAAAITAEQITAGRATPLPKGLVQDFSGLPDFFHVTITDSSGTTVLTRDETFCPNAGALRSTPDAAETSRFPSACASNPFALGAVWGITSGWGASTTAADTATVSLPDGTYSATVSVNQPYRDLFGVRDATQKIQVIAETVAQNASSLEPTQAPAGPAPGTGQPGVGLKPDLRSLPAWNIAVEHSGDGDYLDFSATVWNAGPGPLVVQGFRRTGTYVLDAYQYFDDARGDEVGYTNVGSMVWDPDTGHQHWHFADFARYSLLNSDKTEAVRSQKDGFCLANTDAVDTTVANTTLNPSNTDLHSSCGGISALSVREALAVGWGDTYVQTLPGQSFDITDVPNGAYYVEIVANPDGALAESTPNDPLGTSLREVVLGGTTGHRTVTVPPDGLVTG